MPTLVLNAFSKAYPSITNRIRAAIYLAELPLAIVAEIIDTTSGHPSRTWSFPGLERTNYKFSLDEINGSDVVVSNLAAFDVVPGTIEGSLVRNDEQIKVGQTEGLIAGNTSFIFDGTFEKPNYIGWEIVISEISGRGIMIRGLDYSWDKTTGTFQLLQSGDLFVDGTYYNIHFNSIDTTEGNSYPTLNDYQFNIIIDNIKIDASYFGKKLICSPVVSFITVKLPDIYALVPGRKLMIEVDGTDQQCVHIVTGFGEPINFFNGMIYLLPGERLSIYSMLRDGTPEYRFCDAFGNFTTVGNMVSTDDTYNSSLNMIPLDGRNLNTLKYARLYNQFVLNLPIDQVVNYADWETGNNKYKYSYSDGTNFHIPDRRGMFERNNNTGKAGDFFDHQMLSHQHITQSGGINTFGGGYGATLLNFFVGIFSGPGTGKRDITSLPSSNNGTILPNVGSETMPVNTLINKYVLA
jgi:hypothetical protein